MICKEAQLGTLAEVRQPFNTIDRITTLNNDKRFKLSIIQTEDRRNTTFQEIKGEDPRRELHYPAIGVNITLPFNILLNH